MTRYADMTALERAIAGGDVTIVTDGTTYNGTELYIAPTPAARQLAQAGVHDEASLQAAVIAECDKRALTDGRWADIYANANGQYRPGQRMEPGLKKGVPDLFLAVPSGPYHGMYIELKWQANQPSREQLEWISRLRRRGYHCAVIHDNVQDVIDAIESYLDGACSI